MNGILIFLQENMNPIIAIFGIVIGLLIIVNAIKLSQEKSRIQDLLSGKNYKSIINKKTLEVSESEEERNVTPETVRNHETTFRKICSWYHVWEQFIPLFPLFGILGTVSGLMLQIAEQDIEKMFDSLDLALTSTWWGLIFAIFLKSLVALTSSRIIDDTETILEDYHKKFDNAVQQKNILEN